MANNDKQQPLRESERERREVDIEKIYELESVQFIVANISRPPLSHSLSPPPPYVSSSVPLLSRVRVINSRACMQYISVQKKKEKKNDKSYVLLGLEFGSRRLRHYRKFLSLSRVALLFAIYPRVKTFVGTNGDDRVHSRNYIFYSLF